MRIDAEFGEEWRFAEGRCASLTNKTGLTGFTGLASLSSPPIGGSVNEIYRMKMNQFERAESPV